MNDLILYGTGKISNEMTFERNNNKKTIKKFVVIFNLYHNSENYLNEIYLSNTREKPFNKISYYYKNNKKCSFLRYLHLIENEFDITLKSHKIFA